MPEPATQKSIVYAQLTLVALLWAGQFVAGKLLVQSLPPIASGALRFIAASVVLVPFVLRSEGGLPRLDRRSLRLVLMLSLFGAALWNICFFTALETLSAGRAALIIALNPIAVALGARFAMGEPLHRSQWLGIVLGLIGAAIVITRGDPRSIMHGAIGAGEAMMFYCVLGWAIYTIGGRMLFKTMSPLGVATWSALLAVPMLLAASAFEWDRVNVARLDWQAWACGLYLGVIGTALAFVWFYQGVKVLGASQASIFINLVPVFAVIYAVLVLGEPVLASMVIGGTIVLAGVVLVSRK